MIMKGINKVLETIKNLFLGLKNSKPQSEDSKPQLKTLVQNKEKRVSKMNFSFSETSLERLQGVNPKLVDVVTLALTKYASIDFGVACGLRTKAEQRELLMNGKTTTMKSKHLTGDAVDLYPYFDGAAQWDVEDYFDLVMSMKRAAKDLNVSIRWGGCWTNLEEIEQPIKAVEKYKKLRNSQGRIPFVDCPHFEVIE